MAAAENWTPAIARREVAASSCNESLQLPTPQLASRIRALTRELSALERDALSPRTRRDLVRLVAAAQALQQLPLK
jgi:hypothetical protein